MRLLGRPLPSPPSLTPQPTTNSLPPAQAHPKYGNILASASYDGKVLIWREQASQWTRVFDFALHTASVNLLSWAPHDAGCLLACASSDGSVSVLEFKDGSAPAGTPSSANIDHTIFHAHGLGANAVSWAPTSAPGALTSAAAPGAAPPAPLRRLATGGSDCLVRLWEWSAAGGAQGQGGYAPLVTLPGHTDWVRDVAWSPTVLARAYLATASQDKTVRVWTLAAGQDAGNAASWKCAVLNFECALWRVSWSLSGNVLAVSGGDNKVSLWKEKVRDGGWECVKTIDE